MLQCHRCGAVINQGQRVCPQCGVVLTPPSQPPNSQGWGNSSFSPNYPSDPSKSAVEPSYYDPEALPPTRAVPLQNLTEGTMDESDTFKVEQEEAAHINKAINDASPYPTPDHWNDETQSSPLEPNWKTNDDNFNPDPFNDDDLEFQNGTGFLSTILLIVLLILSGVFLVGIVYVVSFSEDIEDEPVKRPRSIKVPNVQPHLSAQQLENKAQRSFENAQIYFKNGQWAKAHAALLDTLTDTSNPSLKRKAHQLLKKTLLEKQAARSLAQARQASDLQSLSKAFALLQQIPASSRLAPEAQRIRESLRQSLLLPILKKAYQSRRRRRYSHALNLYNSVLDKDPLNKIALAGYKRVVKKVRKIRFRKRKYCFRRCRRRKRRRRRRNRCYSHCKKRYPIPPRLPKKVILALKKNHPASPKTHSKKSSFSYKRCYRRCRHSRYRCRRQCRTWRTAYRCHSRCQRRYRRSRRRRKRCHRYCKKRCLRSCYRIFRRYRRSRKKCYRRCS